MYTYPVFFFWLCKTLIPDTPYRPPDPASPSIRRTILLLRGALIWSTVAPAEEATILFQATLGHGGISKGGHFLLFQATSEHQSSCIPVFMSQNPLEAILRSYESVARCVQTHVSRLFPADWHAQYDPKQLTETNSPAPLPPVTSISPKTATEREDFYLLQPKGVHLEPTSPLKGKSAVPLTKEELGRATWTLLHMIAAQYPDRPSRQQKRDAKELMAIISRLYPCIECADHFKEILSTNPVMAGSQEEFSQWLCHVHNVVNRSLGKPIFPCQRVSARWGKLDCKDRGCDLEGTSDSSIP